jgi:hypothetical protein
MGVGIETEESLSDLGRFAVAAAAGTHLAFAPTADAMRVDGQEFSAEMAGGEAQLSQGDLEPLRFGSRVLIEQMVDGYVGGDEGETVDQFETLLAQRACLPYAGDAQGGLMDQLQGQSRLDLLAWLLRPTAEQIPGAQAEVLGHEEPKSHEVAGDLVGQELPHAALNALGIARLEPSAKQGTLCFDGWFSGRSVAIEFFFEVRSLR